MRIATPFILASLALPSMVAAPFGNSQRQEGNPYAPKPAQSDLTREEEANAKLDQKLQGAWTLTDYVNPLSIVPREDVKGFALIHDGFMTITFQAVGDSGGLFLGNQQFVVQSAAFRYRVTDGSKLQLAGLMGFTNDNEDFELEFTTSKLPREYRVDLIGDRLRLIRRSGVGFELRRTARSEFPQAAIDRLRRPGFPVEGVDDDDPFGG